MRALDLIVKKRNGATLTEEELRFLITGYVNGDIPEYQISSWLMAVYFNGMSREETGFLTRIMIESGTTIDLAGLSGPFVDKHSTGGVGDKVSLILAPLAAACGLQVPMMSGRSLGHTGGTLDKLESIPGYSTAMSGARFREIIGSVGYAMTGQSKDIVPADRLLYALRDVTGTVESVPLITASILSKKFAEGADSLVFDVKCGKGAFMKTQEDARELATSLVETGKSLGKRIIAVLTNMDEPLGYMVGNFLEVEEAVACLGGESGRGRLSMDERSGDLMEVTLRLTAWMLVAGGKAKDVEEAESICRERIADGSAWKTLCANVENQGGDLARMKEYLGTYRAEHRKSVTAEGDGVVTGIDAYKTGMAGVYLGAGRSKTDDDVLPNVGVEIARKVGSRVKKGDQLCVIWGASEESVDQAVALLRDAYTIEANATVEPKNMILEEISTE